MAINGDAKRDYMRDYRKRKRAGLITLKTTGKAASPASATKAAPVGDTELIAARAEIARLRIENARLQAELAKQAKPGTEG